jgi:hypothetical protein
MCDGGGCGNCDCGGCNCGDCDCSCCNCNCCCSWGGGGCFAFGGEDHQDNAAELITLAAAGVTAGVAVGGGIERREGIDRRPQHVRPSTQSQRASQRGTWNQQYPRRTDLMQIPNPTTADTHRLGIPKLTSPQGGPLGSFTAKPLCPPPPYTPYGATVSQTSHNSRGSGADGSSLASVPQSYQPSSGLHTDLQSYGWHSTGGEVSSYNSRKWTPASVAAPGRSFHPHRG